MSPGTEDPEVKYKEEPSEEGEADVEGESDDEGEHLARVQTLINNRNSD